MSNGKRRPERNWRRAAKRVHQVEALYYGALEGQNDRDPDDISQALAAILEPPTTLPGRPTEPWAQFPVGRQMEIWERVFSQLDFQPQLHEILLPDIVGPGYWIILQTPEVPLNQMWRAQQKLYPCNSFVGDYLEAALDREFEQRSCRRDGAYAVAVLAVQEAENKYAYRSATWVREQGVKVITLSERIFLEPFFWAISGFDHLDRKDTTGCYGSRDSDGHVPSVDWGDGRLRVSWDYPDGASGSLRAREVVSAAAPAPSGVEG